MTIDQAIERYVAEILRIVGTRARIEVEVVEAVRQRAQAAGAAPPVVEWAGKVATETVRSRLWHD